MTFKRITDNKITAETTEQFYNEIRMRDSIGYEPGYVDLGKFRLSFTNAVLRKDCVEAHVRIFER